MGTKRNRTMDLLYPISQGIRGFLKGQQASRQSKSDELVRSMRLEQQKAQNLELEAQKEEEYQKNRKAREDKAKEEQKEYTAHLKEVKEQGDSFDRAQLDYKKLQEFVDSYGGSRDMKAIMKGLLKMYGMSDVPKLREKIAALSVSEGKEIVKPKATGKPTVSEASNLAKGYENFVTGEAKATMKEHGEYAPEDSPVAPERVTAAQNTLRTWNKTNPGGSAYVADSLRTGTLSRQDLTNRMAMPDRLKKATETLQTTKPTPFSGGASPESPIPDEVKSLVQRMLTKVRGGQVDPNKAIQDAQAIPMLSPYMDYVRSELGGI